MDKNQATGLALIGLVLLVYVFFFSPEPTPTSPLGADSTTTALVGADSLTKPLAESSLAEVEATNKLTNENQPKIFGIFPMLPDSIVKKTILLKNKDLTLSLSPQGGEILSAQLNDYDLYQGGKIALLKHPEFKQHLYIPTKSGKIDLYSLHYTSASTDTSVVFSAEADNGLKVQQTYVLPAKGFLVKYKFAIDGKQHFSNEDAILHWDELVLKTEKDINAQRTSTFINYHKAEDGYLSFGEGVIDNTSLQDSNAINWLAFKSKFFITGIIPQKPFRRIEISNAGFKDDPEKVKRLEAGMRIPANNWHAGSNEFSLFLGPNNFKVLQPITEDFDKNVYLGWPVINLINRYLVVNVFYWLEDSVGNYGLIILILVILVRLLIFPLTYKSFIGMAKMKVLKPELDEIKAKHGEDMQKIQQEQMQLYQQVGINPLAGCIPLLLQMPILFAMFNFFPNAVELRGQPFLWAEDLSTYDSIITLPFTIPVFGDHVSLFNILLTASTLLLTWYNSQTTTMQGPMQSVAYITPLIIMVVLNSLPAGLNYYYLLSNVASIGQQALIRNFVDEGQIRRKLDENRTKNKNKPPGKFMDRLQQAMKAAEEAKRSEDSKKKKGGK